MKLSVIIPMFNEAPIAADCAKALSECLERDAAEKNYEYEIVFSDDGSTDGCGGCVREFAENAHLSHGVIRVAVSPKNEGKGGAVRRGMLASTGDYAVFTDCDLAYGCDVVTGSLAEAEKTGADVIIGSRAIHPDGYRGYTVMRRIASRVFIRLLSLCAGFGHSDSQCGIKLFTRRAADEVFSRCEVNGWAFDFEALLLAEKLSLNIREYPVTVINHRESKIRLFGDSLKMMRDVMRIKRRIDSLKL